MDIEENIIGVVKDSVERLIWQPVVHTTHKVPISVILRSMEGVASVTEQFMLIKIGIYENTSKYTFKN